jgi:hypothetical protein
VGLDWFLRNEFAFFHLALEEEEEEEAERQQKKG